jgi:hypothetical protein
MVSMTGFQPADAPRRLRLKLEADLREAPAQCAADDGFFRIDLALVVAAGNVTGAIR